MTEVYKIPTSTTSHAHAVNTFRQELDLIFRHMAQAEDELRRKGGYKSNAQQLLSKGRQDGLLEAAAFIRNLIVESPDA